MSERSAAAAEVALATESAGYARGVALVALAGVFWSLGGILVRWIEAASAWQIIFYRSLALVLTLLAIIALRHRGRLRAAFVAAGWNGVAAGACLAAGFIGFILALHHTTVANTLFVLGAAPLFAALLGRWLLGEAVRRATWLAIALASCGITIMVGGGLVLGTLAGNLFALGASLSFAMFSVLLRRGRESDMLPCVGYAGMISAVIAALVVAGLPDPASPPLLAIGARDLALCAAMGVVALGLGLTCFTLGARHVPAVEMTLLSLTELVLGPLWVWLGVGEVPSGYTLLGGGIVLAAISYQALSGARRPRTPPGIV
jgi:drug/metabolite transporter (DMT)-like permease